MSLINKEKVLNGVGKAVDVTNKAADKASSFVKEKEIDRLRKLPKKVLK